MTIRPMILATALALASTSLFAQNAPADGADTPRADQRQVNQERRIDQGIASGSLTKREAHRLNRQQHMIDKAEDRAKSDGQVTRGERARLAITTCKTMPGIRSASKSTTGQNAGGN